MHEGSSNTLEKRISENNDSENNDSENKLYKRCIYTLTGLAVLYTSYLAQDLILLLLVVGLVSLLLSPGMRVLESLKIPRVLGASLLVCAIVVPTGIFAVQLQAPIAKWATVLPTLSEQVSDQIKALNDAIDTKAKEIEQSKELADTVEESSWFSWFDNEPEPAPEKPKAESDLIKNRITESMLSVGSDLLVSAPFVLIQILTTLVLILFTLVYSPAIFKRYVSLFVPEGQQQKVHKLALNAQLELSRYILTVSAVNLCLGLSAMLFLQVIGFKDAILLGAIIGMLNFIPYIGPLIGITLIAIGAYVQWGIDISVIFCMGGVLLLNVIESQALTPLVLANRMKVNPFVIILWLLFCGWMWGLVGVLVAVPLIVCIKLLLSQFSGTNKWLQLITT